MKREENDNRRINYLLFPSGLLHLLLLTSLWLMFLLLGRMDLILEHMDQLSLQMLWLEDLQDQIQQREHRDPLP